MLRSEFIEKMANLINKHKEAYGICCTSAILAQAILESGWGESKLASKYHNYFGMKCGRSWRGKAVNLQTDEEYTQGIYTTITAAFRAYNSMEDGVVGYFKFISTPRYRALRGVTDYHEYLRLIKEAGYATSYSYVNKCIKIVEENNLTRFDDVEVDSKSANASSVINEVKCTSYAQSRDDALAGSYRVTAKSGLRLRNGAGAKFKILTTMSCGSIVKCYGYYTDLKGVKWLYVTYEIDNVRYYGFASSEYLEKI